MANRGNQDVLAAIDEFCRLLAIQIYNVQAFADPEKIAIGGGISAQSIFIDYIRKHIDAFHSQCQYDFPKPSVVTCKFQNDANLIGALHHFLDD